MLPGMCPDDDREHQVGRGDEQQRSPAVAIGGFRAGHRRVGRFVRLVGSVQGVLRNV